MAGPLRFLLDQNFPEVNVLDPQSVDRSVGYEHLRRWRPDLVANTPDWVIYLEAELARFTGIVTHDWHQSVQAEEAFAISQTKLAVITWREPPDDPGVVVERPRDKSSVEGSKSIARASRHGWLSSRVSQRADADG